MDAIQRGTKTCLQVGGIHKHVGSSGKEGGEQSNGRTGGLHLTWCRQGKGTALALTHLFHENWPLCQHCLLSFLSSVPMFLHPSLTLFEVAFGTFSGYIAFSICIH